jgi:hypothetical protein
LGKKITERIGQAQLDEEKPSYRVRQGLSLFLGAPMDSTFTPASIQAAQSVFAQQAAQKQAMQAPAKPKKSTSKLDKVSQSYRTGSEAAALRSQNDH